MDHPADINTPLLKEENVVSVIVDSSAGSSTINRGNHATSRPASPSSDRLPAPPFSGKWQFKIQSSKWAGAFEETGDCVSIARQEYNRRQKAALQTFKEIDGLESANPDQPTTNSILLASGESLAINLSNISNLILLALKIYACVRSGSIAIIASTLDSLLDLAAGAILWFTRYSMLKQDVYNYPIGKSRIQPVGIVIFAAIMATLGVQVVIEAIQQLTEHNVSDRMNIAELEWLCSIMGIATVVKFGLFLYCRSFENAIIQAYSKDHSFDVLSNLLGLAAALLANWYNWWIDPLGAIILSLYTITNWSQTVLENAVSLIGKAAPPEMIQKFTYMALRHSVKIERIDTVRAYTFGSTYFVEVDIELPEDMSLKEAHDIGQSLQDKFERLPEVERAFVHLDHESTHKPEHYVKQA